MPRSSYAPPRGRAPRSRTGPARRPAASPGPRPQRPAASRGSGSSAPAARADTGRSAAGMPRRPPPGPGRSGSRSPQHPPTRSPRVLTSIANPARARPGRHTGRNAGLTVRTRPGVVLNQDAPKPRLSSPPGPLRLLPVTPGPSLVPGRPDASNDAPEMGQVLPAVMRSGWRRSRSATPASTPPPPSISVSRSSPPAGSWVGPQARAPADTGEAEYRAREAHGTAAIDGRPARWGCICGITETRR
jgi:hypothetical protein